MLLWFFKLPGRREVASLLNIHKDNDDDLYLKIFIWNRWTRNYFDTASSKNETVS